MKIDKYDLYSRAVQQPAKDVRFFRDIYRELRRAEPKSMREDFCGAFRLCCEWARLDAGHVAYGLDLDPEAVAYGRKRFLAKLSRKQRGRVRVERKDVLDRDVPKADIIAAQNFSYFIFKEREKLLAYFENCLCSLNAGGVLLLDAFGGPQTQRANEEVAERADFVYYWENTFFDPVTYHARYAIHLRPKGGRKVRDCFTYDWRLWTIPELRELLAEAGFRRTHVYWEGSDEDGEGDGVFTRAAAGEACECWVAYIAAEK